MYKTDINASTFLGKVGKREIQFNHQIITEKKPFDGKLVLLSIQAKEEKKEVLSLLK